MNFKKYIWILFSFLAIESYSQIHEVKVLAKVNNARNKVLIRWAPSTPALWFETDTIGYKLEKFQVVQNGKRLPSPELKNTIIFKIPPFTLDSGAIRRKWFDKFAPILNSKTKAQILADEGMVPDTIVDNQPGMITNDKYAIVWNAIYGKTFTYDKEKGKDEGVIDLSSEQERRFNIVLSMADQDFELAKFIGLGMEDSIAVGEKFLYKVSPNYPTGAINTLKGKSGGTLKGLADFEDLSKIPPYDFSVAFVDSLAHLNWNTSLLDKFYISYDVYRKKEGGEFRKINDYPLIKVGNDNETSITFTDSLVNKSGPIRTLDLNKKFSYYVIGRDPFGQDGRLSPIKEGYIRLFLKNPPFISNLEFVPNTKHPAVEFEIDQNYNNSNALKHFKVSYSKKSNTGYTFLPNIIPVDSLNNGKYKLPINSLDIDKTTYLRVTAAVKNGDDLVSNPVMIQPMDSLAPLAPEITSVSEISRIRKFDPIRNVTDSLIVVKINWRIANPTHIANEGISGYRVFRSQHENEEASQITNLEDIKKDVFFYEDTISYMNIDTNRVGTGVPNAAKHFSLNNKVYYQVRAIDIHENQSPLSEPVFLRKPDRVALPPVVFNDYNMGDDGIGIYWSAYTNTEELFVDFDFQKIQLFKALIPISKRDSIIVHKSTNFNWSLIGEIFEPMDSSYFDIDVKKDSLYAYCTITYDLSNNQSISKPLILQYKPNSNLSAESGITNFVSTNPANTKYLKLNWAHTSTKVVDYTLYRAVGSTETLTQYKIINKDDREFFDLDVKQQFTAGNPPVPIPITYKYGLVANYSDGTHSTLIKTEINY